MLKDKLLLHISYSRHGGAGIAAWRLHCALLQAGYNSWFLTIDDPHRYNKDNKENWLILKNTFFEKFRRTIYRIFSGRKEAAAKQHLAQDLADLKNRIRVEAATLPFSHYDVLNHKIVRRADIINLHWVSKIVDYPSFFRKCDKPVVWTLHDMNPLLGVFHYNLEAETQQKEYGPIEAMSRDIKKKAFASFMGRSVIVAPSGWLNNASREQELLPNCRFQKISYSLPMEVFHPIPKTQARKALNLPDEAYYLLFIADKVGIPRKGFHLLMEALEKIPKNRVKLLVIGEKPTEGVSHEDSIRYTGVIQAESDMMMYYNAADLFVLPSIQDNLPNVMLEAFACGCPVAGFPVGGIKEHVIDGQTGILAKELSPESLAMAISECMLNPEQFSAETIRNYAIENFSPARQAGLYAEEYLKLIKG